MNFVQKLKCSFKNASEMEAYYHGLSISSLKARERSLKANYVAITLSWCTSLFVVLLTARTEPELITLFSIIVALLIVISIKDYRKQKELISKALNRKV